MSEHTLSGPTIDGKTLVETAMEFADNGIPVFPVGLNKAPVWKKGESPNGGLNGFHMASDDPDMVERLFDHPAATGIGMPTGRISDVTVIDVDCGRGKKHRDSAHSWLDQHRAELRAASVSRTGSGGLHYWCRYTPGIMNASSVWAPGVDCRNDGGYIVIPPFMGYRWERHVDRDDWAPPPAPPRVVDKKPIIDLQDGRTPEKILEMRDLIESRSTWHDPVRDIVAHLVGSGWGDAEILAYTFTWTWPGYNPRETFGELCVMIAGARAKWDRRKDPATTEEARLWKLSETWNRSHPDTRRRFYEMIREAGNE